MKLSARIPTIIEGTPAGLMKSQSVACLVDVELDVPEFTSREVDLAYVVTGDPFPTINGTFYRKDGVLYERLGKMNQSGASDAELLQEALLSYSDCSETAVTRYERDLVGRKSKIWPSNYTKEIDNMRGFKPSVLTLMPAVGGVRFSDVTAEQIDAKRTELSILGREMIVIDGALYRSCREPVCAFTDFEKGAWITHAKSSHGFRHGFNDLVHWASVIHTYPTSMADMAFELSHELVRKGMRDSLPEDKRPTVQTFSEKLTLENAFKDDFIRLTKGTLETAMRVAKECAERADWDWNVSADRKLNGASKQTKQVVADFESGVASFADLEAAHHRLLDVLRPHKDSRSFETQFIDRRIRGTEVALVRKEFEFGSSYNFDRDWRAVDLCKKRITDVKGTGRRSDLFRQEILQRAERRGWPEEITFLVEKADDADLVSLQDRFIDAEFSQDWTEVVDEAQAASGTSLRR